MFKINVIEIAIKIKNKTIEISVEIKEFFSHKVEKKKKIELT